MTARDIAEGPVLGDLPRDGQRIGRHPAAKSLGPARGARAARQGRRPELRCVRALRASRSFARSATATRSGNRFDPPGRRSGRPSRRCGYGGEFVLDYESLLLTTLRPWHVCERCGGFTIFPARGLCFAPQCDGRLRALDDRALDATFGDHHYRRRYQSDEAVALEVREHTAQLRTSRDASTRTSSCAGRSTPEQLDDLRDGRRCRVAQSGPSAKRAADGEQLHPARRSRRPAPRGSRLRGHVLSPDPARPLALHHPEAIVEGGFRPEREPREPATVSPPRPRVPLGTYLGTLETLRRKTERRVVLHARRAGHLAGRASRRLRPRTGPSGARRGPRSGSFRPTAGSTPNVSGRGGRATLRWRFVGLREARPRAARRVSPTARRPRPTEGRRRGRGARRDREGPARDWSAGRPAPRRAPH